MDENLIRLLLPPLRAQAEKAPLQKNGNDSDSALILPLVLLLIAEGHDMFLILALMSIIL